jgi:hypothetical protein
VNWLHYVRHDDDRLYLNGRRLEGGAAQLFLEADWADEVPGYHGPNQWWVRNPWWSRALSTGELRLVSEVLEKAQETATAVDSQ